MGEPIESLHRRAANGTGPSNQEVQSWAVMVAALVEQNEALRRVAEAAERVAWPMLNLANEADALAQANDFAGLRNALAEWKATR